MTFLLFPSTEGLVAAYLHRAAQIRDGLSRHEPVDASLGNGLDERRAVLALVVAVCWTAVVHGGGGGGAVAQGAVRGRWHGHGTVRKDGAGRGVPNFWHKMPKTRL